MSGGEREDLHKYQMSPVDCECRKSSDGEGDCCQLQWSGNFFFFLIEIRLEYGFERQLADKKDIGKGLWLGVNQSLR